MGLSGIEVLRLITQSTKLSDDTIDDIVNLMLPDMPEDILVELIERYGTWMKNGDSYYLESADPAPLWQQTFPFHKRHSIARHYVRKFWTTIDEYVHHRQEKIYGALYGKSARVASILETKEGYNFVGYASQRMYWILWEFAWDSPKLCPVCLQKQTNSRIHYGMTEFVCVHCNAPHTPNMQFTCRCGIPYTPQTSMPNSLVSTKFFCPTCRTTWDANNYRSLPTLIKVSDASPPVHDSEA